MRAKVRKSLISALENNEYRKGTNLLKYVDSKHVTRHCVGGILIELYEKATSAKRGKFIEISSKCFGNNCCGTDIKKRRIKKVYSLLGSISYIPDKVIDWAGMSYAEVNRIVSANDDGMSFKGIARIIREENIFESGN